MCNDCLFRRGYRQHLYFSRAWHRTMPAWWYDDVAPVTMGYVRYPDRQDDPWNAREASRLLGSLALVPDWPWKLPAASMDFAEASPSFHRTPRTFRGSEIPRKVTGLAHVMTPRPGNLSAAGCQPAGRLGACPDAVHVIPAAPWKVPRVSPTFDDLPWTCSQPVGWPGTFRPALIGFPSSADDITLPQEAQFIQVALPRVLS